MTEASDWDSRSPLDPLHMWTLRSALKDAIRTFFRARGYLEIDTPIGVVCPGTEVHLGYFETIWQDYRGDRHPYFLRSSPELHMKQAMAQGLPRIFQMAPCFRGGGELAPWHHPEFTMLEWYEAGLGFEGFMDQTEDLLRDTHAQVTEVAATLSRQTRAFPGPLSRISVYEAFSNFVGLTLIDQDPDLAAKAIERGVISVREGDDFETAYFKILIEAIEPRLAELGAVILYDYPPSQAALATVKGGVAKRCEVYVGRVELANGFEELTDPAANRQRILASHARRTELGYPVPQEDQNFYRALEQGLSPSCGNALGFDRWLALILGLDGIDQVIPFRQAYPYSSRP